MNITSKKCDCVDWDNALHNFSKKSCNFPTNIVQFHLNDYSQISLKQLHSVKTFDSKCVGFGEK